MKKSILRDWLPFIGFAVVLAVLLADSAAAALVAGRTRAANKWVDHTYQVLAELSALEATLASAERSQRGWLLTQQEYRLGEHNELLRQTEERLADIGALVADNPVQAENAKRLAEDFNAYKSQLRRINAVAADAGFDAARASLKEDLDRPARLAVREAIRSMRESETRILVERQGHQERLNAILLATLVSSGVLAVVVGVLAFGAAARQAAERAASQRAAVAASERLERTVAALEENNAHAALLAEMSETFQSCRTQEEGYRAIGGFIPRLLPRTSGAIYRHNASRNLVERTHAWGDKPPVRESFEPDCCWGLRRGRAHFFDPAEGGVCCDHFVDRSLPVTCIPMVAHGETIGVIAIRTHGAVRSVPPHWVATADQFSLAFAALALREKLSHLSLRDELTGLYNRRYLQETLPREMARARREGIPMSVAVLDVDHFKKFNDVHGHEAGDLVLETFGRILKERSRGDDVACRFGGEEFVLLMPGASADAARGRVEEIRAALSALQLSWLRQALPRVAASAGVACCPDHADSDEMLFRLADQALYAAKRNGRDRVEIATAGTSGTPMPLGGE